ncbi:MBL fold metallo-hydrolase [Candidatus Woesearchaeota archaeon]|nr:MBL fold metallo-hydrolase [Candidatus Woesearchaeota archaeon]MBT5215960.1 MBL fold metallo-hydrolase [Candidatus Woesearchaeota archaeon]MBT6402328.1 MBL fold metallo-hydrolase [Candidatus Woesearchaeota archaeon]
MKHTEICTVGGYNEVGRNMTAINVAGETIVCDIGFNVQKVVEYQEETPVQEAYTKELLKKIDAIPNYNKIKSWMPQTKAIVATHCHLDHIGGIQYVAPDFKAPIVATPFTLQVIRNQVQNDSLKLPNPYIPVKSNNTFNASKNVKVEFIDIPHSTPETSMLAIHSKQGVYLYATDWKFDNTPVIGNKPNYKRLKELGQKGVKALVVDSLYSKDNIKTPSEKIARELLKDVLLGTENSGAAIVTSCFASHVARLKSIIEFGKKLNRKVVILGRSFGKYIEAAEMARVTKLSDKAEIVSYRKAIDRKIAEIAKKGPEKYIIVCTGGQGETNSVLARMVRGETKFKFFSEDQLIFSNKLIPVEPNLTNRETMENQLKEQGVRIFRDVHVSGHPAKEDLREMINLTNPENIIPCHGFDKLMQPACGLAEEMGFKLNRDIHLMKNGEKIIVE